MPSPPEITVLLCLIATMVVGPAHSLDAGGTKMQKEVARVSALFNATKTICIGRFLIDVPAESEIVYGPAYVGANVEVVHGAGLMLEEVVRKEQADVLNEAKFAEGALTGPSSMLGKVIDGAVQGQKILFAMDSGIFYQLRSFIRAGDDLLITWRMAFPEPRRYEERIALLNAIAQDVISRSGDDVPTKPGLCVDGALFPLPKTFEAENFSLGVRLKTFEDVHFSVEMTAKDEIVESDALEPRIQMAKEAAKKLGHATWYAGVKILRCGKHSIGSWEGFEFLARKPKQKVEGESHEFAFVSHGRPLDPHLPFLNLSLHTGVRGNELGSVSPTISDAEAVYLWDRLTKSIKLRPVVKAVSAAIEN